MALRSPAPFSFPGFDEFNARYVEMLKAWDLLLDGVNPVARTNVAPGGRSARRAVALLVRLHRSRLRRRTVRSFIVAGAGELPKARSTRATSCARRNVARRDRREGALRPRL